MILKRLWPQKITMTLRLSSQYANAPLQFSVWLDPCEKSYDSKLIKKGEESTKRYSWIHNILYQGNVYIYICYVYIYMKICMYIYIYHIYSYMHMWLPKNTKHVSNAPFLLKQWFHPDAGYGWPSNGITCQATPRDAGCNTFNFLTGSEVCENATTEG